MSQPDSITIPESGPKKPVAMAQAVNASVRALLSQHGGPELPAYAEAGMLFMKMPASGAWTLEVYDGAQEIPVATIDPSTHALTLSLRGLEAELDIASAATTDLASKASPKVRITGTTQVSSFGAGVNLLRFVRFGGSLTLKNGAALILPGAADIQTAAGDMAIALSDGAGNWRLVSYQKADGTAVKAPQPSIQTLLNTLEPAMGSMIIFDGTNWIALHAGAAKQVLTMDDSGEMPAWRDGSASLPPPEVITVTGTWNKPAGLSPNALLRILLIGGGGAGGLGNGGGGGGGGGGGYPVIVLASDIPNSASCIIGAGGIAPTTANNSGGPGGDTSFADLFTSTGGRGGGGPANGAGAAGGNGGATPDEAAATGSASGTANRAGNGNHSGGGGGNGGGGSFASLASATGGNSIWGGAGGGGNAVGAPGGTSSYAGNGGDGGTTPSAGQIPGGGGGYKSNGARGEIRITYLGS